MRTHSAAAVMYRDGAWQSKHVLDVCNLQGTRPEWPCGTKPIQHRPFFIQCGLSFVLSYQQISFEHEHGLIFHIPPVNLLSISSTNPGKVKIQTKKKNPFPQYQNSNPMFPLANEKSLVPLVICLFCVCTVHYYYRHY